MGQAKNKKLKDKALQYFFKCNPHQKERILVIMKEIHNTTNYNKMSKTL